MSRVAWVAVIAAIAFPSLALLVVLAVGPPRPPAPPGPPGEHPHPGPHPGKRPPLPLGPGLRDDALVGLRGPLGLTDEQVERIWEIGEPARRDLAALDGRVSAKERELLAVLEADEVDEAAAGRLLEELGALRLEMDRLVVLTPVRLRAVLTPEQRERVVEIWRERGGPLGPPHGPPGGPPDRLPDPPPVGSPGPPPP